MRRLWTARWILVHSAVVALVVGFLGLGWWQVGRAAEGNLLSFGYAVEWPVFAAFVIFVWVKEMRRVLREASPPDEAAPSGRDEFQPAASPTRRVRDTAAYDDSDDAELAAYNRYLAWLNANPHAPVSKYSRAKET